MNDYNFEEALRDLTRVQGKDCILEWYKNHASGHDNAVKKALLMAASEKAGFGLKSENEKLKDLLERALDIMDGMGSKVNFIYDACLALKRKSGKERVKSNLDEIRKIIGDEYDQIPEEKRKMIEKET